jgi:hypothetical protein
VRLRIRVVAAVLCMLVVVALPGSAVAYPQHLRNNHLSINAGPNPIVAGDGVLVFGRLAGTNPGGKLIRLYQRLEGSGRGYSLVASTVTDVYGFYEFSANVPTVLTNRDWFVAGPGGAFSRTYHERVAADITLAASTATAVTGQEVTFSGHVIPNHAFERVLLQAQIGASDDWRTIASGLLGPGSGFTIHHRWRTPGERDVRVVLPADARNIRSESDAVPVTIQQAQVTGFTINSSAPVTPYQQAVNISGVITPGPTAQPATVQLWAHPAGGGPFQLIDQGPVSANGSYGFTETPLVNTVYQARTAFGAVRASAQLWQGVRDLLTLTPSSNTSTVGGVVTFMGTVTPAKAGHVVYLQRRLPNGDWQSVEASFVRADSTFQFVWRFGKPGIDKFRARIYSDGRNVGTFSTPPVTITVSGLAPVTTLPSGS